VEIDLRKALSPPRPGPLTLVFGTTFRDPLSETILTLRRLSRDSGTKVVVLRSGGLPLGLGRAEELRAAIENLKGSGKKVLFYLESGETSNIVSLSRPTGSTPLPKRSCWSMVLPRRRCSPPRASTSSV